MWGKIVGGVRTRRMDKVEETAGEKPLKKRTGGSEAKIRVVSPSQGRMRGVESGGAV